MEELWGKPGSKKDQTLAGQTANHATPNAVSTRIRSFCPSNFATYNIQLSLGLVPLCRQTIQGSGIPNIFGSETNDSLSQLHIVASHSGFTERPSYLDSPVTYYMTFVHFWNQESRVHDPFTPISFMLLKSTAYRQHYQIQLPAWDEALAPSGPQHLCADPEEIFPERFHNNDPGLLLITADSVAPANYH